jgi:hypothetical protein
LVDVGFVVGRWAGIWSERFRHFRLVRVELGVVIELLFEIVRLCKGGAKEESNVVE